MNKTCVCLITHKPDAAWLEFLQRFRAYDVFVIIDDQSLNYSDLYASQYPDITCVQVRNIDCRSRGFVNTNHAVRKKISGWDKALYYFCTLNDRYENIWFIEDDVFFGTEETLAKIDAQYADTDLLASKCVKDEDSLSWYHWKRIQINFAPPYYKSMVCAVRMSRALMSLVGDYAERNGTLFFLEALFPSVAKKADLSYACPRELQSIMWRNDWAETELDNENLFHPIKDFSLHRRYREAMTKK